jgi:glyoxylase-like metal-dependent hydrolase (beta-lactamase superfamily II)
VTARAQELIARLAASARAEAPFEALALRYGTLQTTRSQLFADLAPDDATRGELTGMDFFLWVLRSERALVVVDTGFDPAVAQRRGRACLVAPADALASVGVKPADVEHLLLTHLHYDHAGNVREFAQATIHVPRAELDDCGHDPLVERADLIALRSADEERRVLEIVGETEIVPGVIAVHVGGHTPGQSIVLAHRGERAPVVLASDAAHFYEEIPPAGPSFAIFSDAADLRAGCELLCDLAALGATVVPGHDPSVSERHELVREHVVRIC